MQRGHWSISLIDAYSPVAHGDLLKGLHKARNKINTLVLFFPTGPRIPGSIHQLHRFGLFLPTCESLRVETLIRPKHVMVMMSETTSVTWHLTTCYQAKFLPVFLELINKSSYLHAHDRVQTWCTIQKPDDRLFYGEKTLAGLHCSWTETIN